MKKVGSLLVIILVMSSFLIAIATVSAVDITDPNSIPGSSTVQKITNLSQRGVGLINGSYLAGEWKTMLLKNKFIAFTDSVFTKFSLIFFILFGQNYSLSLKLLLVIILWLYFFFLITDLFEGFSLSSQSSSSVVSLGITIIIAHVQIFKLIIDGLYWLTFAKKGWIWNLGIAVAEVIGFIIIYYFGSYFSKILKANKEEFKKMLKEAEEYSREVELEAAKKAAEKQYGVGSELPV